MQATRGPAGRSPGGRARRGLVVHLEPYFVAIGTALDPPAVGILLTRTRPQPPSLPAGGGPCHLNLGPPLRTTSRAIPASQVTSSSAGGSPWRTAFGTVDSKAKVSRARSGRCRSTSRRTARTAGRGSPGVTPRVCVSLAMALSRANPRGRDTGDPSCRPRGHSARLARHPRPASRQTGRARLEERRSPRP